ncbi:MAG TPA: ABC transporter transmembrane domain-containing protein, partial [Candidatus Binatia bacterium]|nr:ABC transporter transmembrane domain-containing protein [Candidatus Binatia bacterium]
MTLYARIRSYVRPYVWPQGVLAVVCMLGFSASEGAVPFLLKYTVDRVLKPPAVVQAEVPPPRAPGPRVGKLPVDFVQRRLDDFVRTYLDPLVPKAAAPLSLVVIGFFVLVQLRGWFDFGAGYLTDWIGFRVVTDLRNQETAHLQRLDHAFFNRQRAGQIVSRVTADASAVRGMVTDVVTSIFQDITRLIMFMGVAVYMDWRLAVIAVGLFPVAAGPLWYFSKQLRLTSRRQQEGTGRLNAMLHENVQGNRVVKAFGQEEYEVRRLRAHNEHLFGLSMRASLIRGVPVTEMLASVSVALILWFGGKSVIDGSRTAGDFFAFLTALVLLYDPFKKLVKANNNIQSGLAGAERV